MGINLPEVIFSTPLQKISIYPYTLPQSSIIEGKQDLAGKVIALDIAAGSLKFFKSVFIPNSSKVILANSTIQALSLLKQGRVDVAIATDFDVALLFGKDPNVRMDIQRGYNIAVSQDVITCWRNASTEKFLSHVNIKLDTLGKSGRLNEILANKY